jgi:capsular exopolysaccharide synthesis family protein
MLPADADRAPQGDPVPNDSPADWLRPPEEQEGLQRYVETLRERFWLVVSTVAIATVVAILYVLLAGKTYEAEADLLITPVNADDAVLANLGLIGGSADPSRDVETASQLVTSIDVAAAVKQDLDSPLSPSDLLAKVSAVPVAQSNIVAVTATADSPAGAKQLADAFAAETVDTRTQKLHEQIEQQLPTLRSALNAEAGTAPSTETAIGAQIAQLELLASAPTPDMQVQAEATPPTAPASPQVALSIAAGLVAGLILGIVAAFGAQVLDPRLRREAQLRRLYRLPTLGRIPREARTGSSVLLPRRLSPATTEAYRTLRTTLVAGRSAGQVIFVTGSGASEGKSTTALNLAVSIALSGKRVLLMESDLRKPVFGRALGIQPENGIVSVLLEKLPLEAALAQTDTYGPNLQLLLADREGAGIAELFSLGAAQGMVEEARKLADYVIVDSPPLNEVVDALPLAEFADSVLIVAKLGKARLDKLAQLGELLAENGIRPAGFCVVGVPRPRRGDYAYRQVGADGASPARPALDGRTAT